MRRTYNIVLGTAVVTIILSPFVTRLGDRIVRDARQGWSWDRPGSTAWREPSALAAGASRTEQAITADEEARRPGSSCWARAGWASRRHRGRARGFRCVVVDRDARRLEAVKRLGATTVFGDAANPEILKRLGLERARVLVIAIGDPLSARLAAERARGS